MAKAATVVREGQRGARARVPVVSVVVMAEVPEPPSGTRSYWADMYDKMRALSGGNVLKLQFSSESQAAYARTRLKKLANADKSHGKMFSSSRSADGLTRYFWLEEA